MSSTEIEKRVREALMTIRRMSYFLSLDMLLTTICESIVEILGYQAAWIGLIDERSQEIRPVGQAGIESDSIPKIEVRYDDSPLGKNHAGEAIRRRRPVVQRDLDKDPSYSPWRDWATKKRYRSALAVPLLSVDAVIGVLSVYSEKEDSFNDYEIGVLQSFADNTVVGMERAKKNPEASLEPLSLSPKKSGLQEGESYLFSGETSDEAFKAFVDHALHGYKGLCITREKPESIAKRYRISKTSIFWLTNLRGTEEKSTETLTDVQLLIGSFLSENEKAVVLLDGLEYLISNNGFQPVYSFIQSKRSQIAQRKAIMIVPVNLETLDKKEQALLKRELQSPASLS
jgi:hypothetical protein